MGILGNSPTPFIEKVSGKNKNYYSRGNIHSSLE